ncbi:hypothetical protein CH289_03335 [Rhodococcus sp. RS1C4]|nr:hypothetical protein CH289_03335 [Rhodococcus sp. RS1C4]
MTPSLQVDSAYIDLFWLPLGAGGHSVRWNGRIFEWINARIEHRSPHDLYHSALVVHLPTTSYVIEMTPVRPRSKLGRGVVATGPVGLRMLGQSSWFRYEIHRWESGTIADKSESVQSPRRLTVDEEQCVRAHRVVSEVPTSTWGRDELGTGDMWNSNSVVSWVLTRAGVDATTITPPLEGSAPGWAAGIVAALRGA